MTIQTKRLLLRPFCDEDKVWYCNLVKDKEIKQRLPGLEAKNDGEAKSHVDIFKGCDFVNDFYYVITNKEGQVVGLIVAVRITGKMIDVSYFIYKKYRYNGFMQEALRFFIHKIRTEVENYYFRFVIDTDNIDSLKVIRKFNPRIEKNKDKYICYV